MEFFLYQVEDLVKATSDYCAYITIIIRIKTLISLSYQKSVMIFIYYLSIFAGLKEINLPPEL